MECRTVIKERRSIRMYEQKPIDQQTLEQILDAALMAPSAINLQPWYFVVIQSEKAMKELKLIMSQASLKLRPNLEKRFSKHPEVVEETCKFVNQLGGAPVCVLAFQLKPDYDKTAASIIQSVAAAIDNMLLAAWDLGVGSCWLTAPIEAGVDQAIKEAFAPDKGDMVAMITLGYPARIPNEIKRKENRHIIL